MRLLIDGAMWDGTGAAPFPGKVLIENERMAAVAPQTETVASNGAERIDAGGKNSQGKGIWVVQGSDNIVENVEMSGAAVADRNGAAIRLEGSRNRYPRFVSQ